MSTLVRAGPGGEASWYAVHDESATPVERYVVSTPDGRAIVNHPEIVGHAYTTGLGRAVRAALETAPFHKRLEATPEEEICVLHILRGGLSFGLREALGEALGLTRHGSAFLSSQRAQATDGSWSIYEDLYRKLDVPDGGVLLLADVVATGTTLEHALEVLGAEMARRGHSLRRIVLFTIGGAQAEAILARCHTRLAEAHRAWEGATVVYLEGRFTLAKEGDGSVPGMIRTLPVLSLPGTDLLRAGALLAPEFEASQAEQLGSVLERCAVYDAGSRAFDVPHYLQDVLGYWRRLGDLARDGLTLAEALAERWPAGHPQVGTGDAAALRALCAARMDALSPPRASSPRRG